MKKWLFVLIGITGYIAVDRLRRWNRELMLDHAEGMAHLLSPN